MVAGGVRGKPGLEELKPLFEDGSLLESYCRGRSMEPTLRGGDALRIRPLGKSEPVRPGDVVVFRSPLDETLFAHRIVEILDQGIRSWGDNNRLPDDDLLSRDRLLGRVESRRRGTRIRKVWGGRIGLLRFHRLRLKRLLMGRLSRPGWVVYRWLAEKGWFRNWHKPFLRLRPVRYRRQAGEELQLQGWGRCWARKRPWNRAWVIRFPMRLFLDERELSGLVCRGTGVAAGDKPEMGEEVKVKQR